MLVLITVVHLILATLLIVFVLLQDPKGGGAFGIGATAGTQGVFGASGASNFLVTATKWVAGFFAVTCIALSYVTVKREKSVTEGFAPVPAPAATAPAEAGTPTEAPATENK